MWRVLVPRWRTAVKPSSNCIVLVINDERVNSTSVDLVLNVLRPSNVLSVFIRSVLEVPNLSGRSCQIGQPQLHLTSSALICIRTRNRKPIRESLEIATTRSVFCVKNCFVSPRSNFSLWARFRCSARHARKKG